MKRNRYSFLGVLVCVLLSASLPLRGQLLHSAPSWSQGGSLQISPDEYTLLQFFNFLTSYYVDSIAGEKEYVETAMKAVLAELDPHSNLINESDADQVEDELQGHFDGVGIEFTLLRDTLHVVGVIPGGPSERVGLRAGDKVIKADGKKLSDMKLTNRVVRSLLRGPRGSRIDITALRGEDTLEFVVEREKIPVKSVDVEYVTPSGAGYVRLNRFSLNSYQELRDALSRLRARDARGYILDLRGNGGGVMQAAVDIAGLFLHADALVVYAQGRNVPRQDFFVKNKEKRHPWRKVPLVVLVDEYSSSASEILSGALQDWDRAILVGRRTFGKGLIQSQVSLLNGSLLRLSVARYYTPSGRTIQTPYRLGAREDYAESFRHRYFSGEFFHVDSVPHNDSLLMFTLRAGRPVYGGGGIMPDVFVPLDTMEEARAVNQIDRLGFISNFAYNLSIAKRDSLRKLYPNTDRLMEGYALSGEDYVQFQSRLDSLSHEKSLGIVFDSLSAPQKELMNRRLMAYLIRNLYSYSEMVRYINGFSEEIRRAEGLLLNWSSEGETLLRGHREK